jgi:hypothetical protein
MSGNREGEAATLNNMGMAYDAIGDYHRLDRNVQRTYLRSVEITYRALAELLIAEGRPAEAQQILNAFKDQQYFDFDQTQVGIASLVRRPREAEFSQRYEKAIGAINATQGSIAELKRKIRNRDANAAEAQQLKQLEEQYKAAVSAFPSCSSRRSQSFRRIATRLRKFRTRRRCRQCCVN